MGKNTKKSAAGRKPKETYPCLNASTLRDKLKTKYINKQVPAKKPFFHSTKMSKLLNQEILSCPICLQVLLSPVLAQCGHSFCLHCSEDLAKNGFACGICHTHLPTYDLPHSNIIEKLIYDYLDHQEGEERQNYLKRKKEMQRKQASRRIEDIELGAIIDYWCEEELAWKTATVTFKTKNQVILNPNKNTKEVVIESKSRRLAPHRTFTKDQPIPDPPQFQFRGMNLPPSPQFDPIRMRMMSQRPYLFGMPMFVGYYWRDGSIRPDGELGQEDNPFTF